MIPRRDPHRDDSGGAAVPSSTPHVRRVFSVVEHALGRRLSGTYIARARIGDLNGALECAQGLARKTRHVVDGSAVNWITRVPLKAQPSIPLFADSTSAQTTWSAPQTSLASLMEARTPASSPVGFAMCPGNACITGSDLSGCDSGRWRLHPAPSQGIGGAVEDPDEWRHDREKTVASHTARAVFRDS